MTAYLFYLFHQKFTKTDHNIQLVLAHASLGHWSSLVLWSRDVAHEDAQGKHDQAEGELSADVSKEEEDNTENLIEKMSKIQTYLKLVGTL